jgi:hypothetical protein
MSPLHVRVWVGALILSAAVTGCATRDASRLSAVPASLHRLPSIDAGVTGADESTDPANASCGQSVTCVIQGGANSVGPYDIDPCPLQGNAAICAMLSFSLTVSSVPPGLTESFSALSGGEDTMDRFTVSAASTTSTGRYPGSDWTLQLAGAGSSPPVIESPVFQVLCSIKLGTCANPIGPNATYECLPEPPEIGESTGTFSGVRKAADVSRTLSATPSPGPTPQVVIVQNNSSGSCAIPTPAPSATPTSTPSPPPVLEVQTKAVLETPEYPDGAPPYVFEDPGVSPTIDSNATSTATSTRRT